MELRNQAYLSSPSDKLEMREKVRFPQRKAVVAIHKQKVSTDKAEWIGGVWGMGVVKGV